MAARYFLLIAVCLWSHVSSQGLEVVNGTIKITVSTTAGCSDTVTLFQDQLIDTYENYKDFLELDFIPWGRTIWHDDGTFTCQFNPHNCWANRLHRCVLHLLKGNQDAQMKYMSCEFSDPSPSFDNGTYVCAQEVGLNLVNIDHCVNNGGDDLDREAEARGSVITSTIGFVPGIVLNDDINTETHWAAFERLKSMVCIALSADSTTGVDNCPL